MLGNRILIHSVKIFSKLFKYYNIPFQKYLIKVNLANRETPLMDRTMDSIRYEYDSRSYFSRFNI